jgi:hypothetical protein
MGGLSLAMVRFGVLNFARFFLMLRRQHLCRSGSLLAERLDAGAYADLVCLSSGRLTAFADGLKEDDPRTYHGDLTPTI